MKVLIGNHISFETNIIGLPFAMIFGKYEIKNMTAEEFELWADQTSKDWITEDYDGEIYFSSYVSKENLFEKELV